MTRSRIRWMSLLATLSFLITYPSIYVVILFRTSEELLVLGPNVEQSLADSIRTIEGGDFRCLDENHQVHKAKRRVLTVDDILRLDNVIMDARYELDVASLSPEVSSYTWSIVRLDLNIARGVKDILEQSGQLSNSMGIDRELPVLCNQAAERAAIRRRLEEAAMAFESDNAKHGKLLRDLKDEIDAMVDEAVGPHSEEERREIEAAGQKAVQEHKAKLQEFQREFHKGLEEHRTRRWGIAAIALLDVLILLGGYACAAIVIRQWLRDRRNRDRAGAAK